MYEAFRHCSTEDVEEAPSSQHPFTAKHARIVNVTTLKTRRESAALRESSLVYGGGCTNR